jgi:hypothetical protein
MRLLILNNKRINWIKIKRKLVIISILRGIILAMIGCSNKVQELQDTANEAQDILNKGETGFLSENCNR